MAHFEKHNKSINSLLDVTEAMLHAMEKHGVDPETVANKPEFSVLIHFLKSIIDGELNIPTYPTRRGGKPGKKPITCGTKRSSIEF